MSSSSRIIGLGGLIKESTEGEGKDHGKGSAAYKSGVAPGGKKDARLSGSKSKKTTPSKGYGAGVKAASKKSPTKSAAPSKSTPSKGTPSKGKGGKGQAPKVPLNQKKKP